MSGIKGTIEQGLVKVWCNILCLSVFALACRNASRSWFVWRQARTALKRPPILLTSDLSLQAIGKLKSAPTVSQFLSTGRLTPEEFVIAGDMLVYKCPAWVWGEADGKHAVAYLPPAKQYLIIRNAPCAVRASEIEQSAAKATYRPTVVDGDDGWVCDDTGVEGTAVEVIPEANVNSDADSDGSIPDMEGYDEENVVDEHALTRSGNEHLVAQRSYDISITYDNYYNTPRMWLYGYDEKHKPLTATSIFDDISEEHARKTVTVDAHPYLSTQSAYIHPCKHADVMKLMLERMVAHGKTPRVDHYLFVFLKFMSSVIPTIEYDIRQVLRLICCSVDSLFASKPGAGLLRNSL
jgi:ubiquitin-like-conjugating enzyme ATG3